MEFFKDKTVIHYECTNLLIALPDHLVIVDESGKEYGLTRETIKAQDGNKFISEIGPLSKDKKYTLRARDFEKLYDAHEDLKFTIEVN